MLQAVDARLEGSRCSSASVLVILVELPLGELVAGLELAALAAQSLGHGYLDLLVSSFVRAAGLMAVWVTGLRVLWGGGRSKRMGESLKISEGGKIFRVLAAQTKLWAE
jgi:hypothetical protein